MDNEIYQGRSCRYGRTKESVKRKTLFFMGLFCFPFYIKGHRLLEIFRKLERYLESKE